MFLKADASISGESERRMVEERRKEGIRAGRDLSNTGPLTRY